MINETSNTSSPPLGKLGQCQICEGIGKYKCPRCGVSSCSLSCVKEHKTRQGCNGIRNRAELIYKNEMDNFTLLNDYRFLEEIDHKLEDCRRNPLRRAVKKNKESLSDLPPHLKILKNEGKKRKTIIEFMPKHFLMHTENSTRFLFTERKIRWHIKWVFPQADLSFSQESVDENCVLFNLLQKYMEPPNRLDDAETPLSFKDCNRLEYYHSASYRRIAVLFKSIGPDPANKKYIELNLSKSLKVNLVNKYVIEYPVFYVVLRDHLDAYIDEDNDVSSHVTSLDDPSLGSVLSEGKDHKAHTNIYPRVEKRDGGLSFFNAHSDVSEESD